jgi:hypothetical protein
MLKSPPTAASPAGRIVLLSVCAVILGVSRAPLASAQIALPPVSMIYPSTADANRDGESMLVSGQIRSALWSDPALSALAKQIDIRASPQAVVLRGAVAPGETTYVEAVAREYAGARRIENQLTVGSPAPREH